MKDQLIGILQKIVNGFLAGMLISIGGAVFLACYAKNADGSFALSYYVGSLLFCTALLCICVKGYSLYTGKIGYLPEKHSKEDVSVLLLGLLGNVIATTVFGFLLAWIFPSLKETAETLCTAKLGQGYLMGFLRAFFCGIMVYLAVDIYCVNKTPLGIVFCIPVFILSGYEHSIADMFYFATSGIVSAEAFGYLMMIVLGNSASALLLHLAVMFLRLKPKKAALAPAEGQNKQQKEEQNREEK